MINRMEELTTEVKQFILWKDDLKTPFETVYNGTDKTKPKISYRKGNSDKSWSLEEVWQYWNENIFVSVNKTSI